MYFYVKLIFADKSGFNFGRGLNLVLFEMKFNLQQLQLSEHSESKTASYVEIRKLELDRKQQEQDSGFFPLENREQFFSQIICSTPY